MRFNTSRSAEKTTTCCERSLAALLNVLSRHFNLALMNALIIVAAGRGTRASTSEGLPKQFCLLAGIPMIRRTIECFVHHMAINRIITVIHPDDFALYEKALGQLAAQILRPVAGGNSRQTSVKAGLDALQSVMPEYVLIHDAARPFVSNSVINRIFEALKRGPAAIPAIPLVDTLKRDDGNGQITGTVPRYGLWRAQTPQGFHYKEILAAHEAALSNNCTDFTDDASLMEWQKRPVEIVPGEEINRKLTTTDDIAMAEREFYRDKLHDLPEVRVGQGFDVHMFGPGDHVMLCGVKIAHAHALIGHSDADVGLHALTDAIFGALGEGDIGAHFPPSDPNWRGAASDMFLRAAASAVRARNGLISLVDLTLICEEPKIGPVRDTMRNRVAEILDLSIDRVSIKATTSEGLGFTGRKEGVAAFAIATIRLPHE